MGEKDINCTRKYSNEKNSCSAVGQVGNDQKTRWDFAHEPLLLQCVYTNLRVKSNLPSKYSHHLINFISHSPFINFLTLVLISLLSCPPNSMGISAGGPWRSPSLCLELLLLCFSSGPGPQGQPVWVLTACWRSLALRTSHDTQHGDTCSEWSTDRVARTGRWLGDLCLLQIRKSRSREGEITQPSRRNCWCHELKVESKWVSWLLHHCMSPPKPWTGLLGPPAQGSDMTTYNTATRVRDRRPAQCPRHPGPAWLPWEGKKKKNQCLDTGVIICGNSLESSVLRFR